MMPKREHLGSRLSIYRASRRKLLLTIALGVVLLLTGLVFASSFWGVYPAVSVVLLLSTILGEYLVIRHLLNTIGRVAEVYEGGVCIRKRGSEVVWPYEKIDEVTVWGSHVVGGIGMQVEYFAFTGSDGEAFTIKDHYVGWLSLGTAVADKVAEVRVPEMIQRMRRGTEFPFDWQKGTLGVKSETLRLTREGIAWGTGEMIFWPDVEGCEIDPQGLAYVVGVDGGRLLTFAVHNVPNAWLLMRGIQTAARTLSA